MHSLSDIQRDALCLAYFDGLTHVEISESLNVPLGTAKTAIRRGIAILREFFDCVSSGDDRAMNCHESAMKSERVRTWNT